MIKKQRKKLLFKTLSLFTILMQMVVYLLIPISIKADNVPFTPISLDFIPKQTIINPTKPIMYAIDGKLNKVFSINLETNVVSAIQLNLLPERLYFANNKLYVALLKSGHQYYGNLPEEGSIAIIDPDIFSQSDQFDVDIDPFDIVVDNNDIIYINGGSNQSSSMRSYSTVTKLKISSSSITMRCYAQLHPTMNKIYTITTDLSPRDIATYAYSNGTFTTPYYDSPYHGNYNMSTNMKISPDGKYIFNGAGTIFKCSDNKFDDMKYVYTLNSGFNDIAFDIPNNKFYTSIAGGIINVYSYDDCQQIGTYKVTGDIKSLFYQNDNLMYITNTSNSNCYIEYINKNDMISIPEIPNNNSIKIVGRISNCIYGYKNNKAYAVDKAFNKLYIMNLGTNEIEKTLNLSYTPSALCLSEDESKIYIANDDLNCLVTELDLNNYAIRNLSYSAPANAGDYAYKQIYIKQDKLYVVTGEWAPKLLVFNVDTFAQINYGTTIDQVGGMAFSSDNKYFYMWKQYGWNAGSLSSGLVKYSIQGDKFAVVDQYCPSYTELSRDPLGTPIILLESQQSILFKNRKFNMNNLMDNVKYFPEEIYASNPNSIMAAGKKGTYLISDNKFTKFNSIIDKILFFNNNDVLYLQKGKYIYPYMPGDLNGDFKVDSNDIVTMAQSYNVKKEDSKYDSTKDFNSDDIVDIYDLVNESKLLPSN